MDGDCVRICKETNGFTVEMKDPAIVKANNKRDNTTTKNGSYAPTPWRDSWKSFVFKDKAEVLAFLDKNLDKALKDSGDEFSTSFDLAVADTD